MGSQRAKSYQFCGRSTEKLRAQKKTLKMLGFGPSKIADFLKKLGRAQNVHVDRPDWRRSLRYTLAPVMGEPKGQNLSNFAAETWEK